MKEGSKAKLIPEGLQLLGEEGDGCLTKIRVFRQDKKIYNCYAGEKSQGVDEGQILG